MTLKRITASAFFARDDQQNCPRPDAARDQYVGGFDDSIAGIVQGDQGPHALTRHQLVQEIFITVRRGIKGWTRGGWSWCGEHLLGEEAGVGNIGCQRGMVCWLFGVFEELEVECWLSWAANAASVT
jgi:hypothetical protein